jgi:uncharacterized RDD family membrane protein YckC
MKENYPSLARRYLATTLDVFLVILTTIAVVKILDGLGLETGLAWYLVFVPVIFYEPVMTSQLATLGQVVFRFRIRDANSGNKINLLKAYIRLFIKFVLDVISILTIPNDEKRRAIHDKVVATVAINVNTIK